MDLICEERNSDEPFIARVWRSQGQAAGPFISVAETNGELVVTKYRGKTAITLRGPSTQATPAYCPEDAEFFGIQFKPGAFLAHLPAKMVMNRHDLFLPEESSKSFWLSGSAWQYPSFENADHFVKRLVQDGLLVYDPIVEATLHGQPMQISLRTVQRRFLQATGLTHNTLYQIHRAQYAANFLRQGISILETVQRAGYFDQPHLTRSLKHLIGLTPAQIMDPGRPERLSFLYKKEPPWLYYNTNVLRTMDIPSPALSTSS